MDSIWRKMNHNPEKLAFSGHIQTEAAVIGGGMAGILTAFFLQEAGIKTILLEAGHIGEGQTGNTTAKITAQHGLIFDGLITSLGMERAELYAKANQTAIEEYRQLVERLEISCDWQDTFSCVYNTGSGGSGKGGTGCGEARPSCGICYRNRTAFSCGRRSPGKWLRLFFSVGFSL
ncbi:MAG: NAD(P)/FAD-dependent oxidoreductase [Eisenbergiella sp.]